MQLNVSQTKEMCIGNHVYALVHQPITILRFPAEFIALFDVFFTGLIVRASDNKEPPSNPLNGNLSPQ